MYSRFQKWLRAATVVAACAFALPMGAQGPQQLRPGVCDFDIADDLGRLTYGNTVHLVGRAGQSTGRGQFFIINADKPDMDVDQDGYGTPNPGAVVPADTSFTARTCTFRTLYIDPQRRFNLVNVEDPALAIPEQNIILVNLPRVLLYGTMARAEIFVELPEGTAAGTYVGEFQLRDSVYGVRLGSNSEILAADRLTVEVRVVEQRDLTIVNSDSAVALDSLVIRGRAGQLATGTARIANTGNTPLSNVQVTATDLRSESAVGLVIPGQNVRITPSAIAGLLNGDTARVTVAVQIPRGILGGRYRGSLIVQAQGVAAQQIPLILIVTSTRGILFGNNPVREINGDIANIAFNGDPGTEWKLSIFDMGGIVSFKQTGTVFAGTALPGGGGALIGQDFAVNVIWPLRNGRGEGVASGMYLVVVESIVNGQRQLAQDKLMVIR